MVPFYELNVNLKCIITQHVCIGEYWGYMLAPTGYLSYFIVRYEVKTKSNKLYSTGQQYGWHFL